MDFVRVGSLVLHAQRDGDPHAPVIVLANPLGTDLRVWGRVVPYLADRMHVVRYDQRGHGLSSLGAGPCTIEDLALDLAGLLDQLDTGPAFVCGAGLGAATALSLSAQSPALVTCVALGAMEPLGTVPAAWQDHIARVRADGLAAVAASVLAGWFPKPFLEQRPSEIDGWRAMLTRTDPDGYLHAAAALRDMDPASTAAAIRVPTLGVLVDDASPAALPHAAATGSDDTASLVLHIPGAKTARVAASGELASVTQPGALAAALLAFWETRHGG